jgi:hypothetical protein
MKSRKVILFIITLIAVIVLAILAKDTAAIVALYGTYCAGNVGAKFSGNLYRNEK